MVAVSITLVLVVEVSHSWWTSSLDQSEQRNLFLSLRHHIFQERSPLNTTQKTRELSPASRLSL